MKESNKKAYDLTGQKFGRLTVVSFHETNKHAQKTWICRCDCGTRKIIITSALTSGHSKSCGCLSREMSAKRAIHGHNRNGGISPEYSTWLGMRARCQSPICNKYENYGGRGIMVCEQWENSFQEFLKDMGPKPSLKHSIDRIDVNGNYEPGNCRWATGIEQAANKRAPEIKWLRRDAKLAVGTMKTGEKV